MTESGPINGREAIEKWYADLFQQVQFSNHVITADPDSPHIIGTAGNEMWATGEWSTDIKGKDCGPIQIKGYWSVIREGDDWKIRMLTSNTTPAPCGEVDSIKTHVGHSNAFGFGRFRAEVSD